MEVNSFDDFAASNNIDQIDFLKIDVEGAEYCMLEGSQQLLARSLDVIVMVEVEEDWSLRNGFKHKTRSSS